MKKMVLDVAWDTCLVLPDIDSETALKIASESILVKKDSSDTLKISDKTLKTFFVNESDISLEVK